VLVTIDDVKMAQQTARAAVTRTPLLRYSTVSKHDSLWLKAESLQNTGSFKVRGAYHAIHTLSPKQRERGVVTYSSGNHAQAVAFSASLLRIPCSVFMPDDAKPVKIDATRSWGAEIVLVPPGDRKHRAEEFAAESGYNLVPPYDSPHVIAGQGTVGLEIVQDLPDVEAVFVPIGGGALASGTALAVKALKPSARVIGVEPELAGDAHEGFRSGKLSQWSVEMTSRTIADGLRTNLCELTFEHILHYVDDVVTVTENQIADTVVRLAKTSHLVVEPSGAVALAGCLRAWEDMNGRTSVAVLSGGNVDHKFLAESLLARASAD